MLVATIDIGTNSVLLLIAEIDSDGSIRTIEDSMMVTRLGEGLGNSGSILPSAADRTLAAMKVCLERCASHGAKNIAAIGTAPLRTASNASEFCSRAKTELGIDIEIASSEREARLAFKASAHDFGREIAVLDIGGGSTELVTPDEGATLRFASLPIGCVSLTEAFLKTDPPSREEVFHLRRSVRERLEEGIDPMLFARAHDHNLVATDGTATTLASMHLKLSEYDAERIHGSLLKIDDLRDLIDALSAIPLEKRRLLPGLAPERADVILAGAELLQEAMSFLGFARVTVSNRGMRWGLFYEINATTIR